MSKLTQTVKDLLGAEKFEALKNLFATQKFTEVAAKDGSTLTYDGELKEGVEIFVVTADGNVAVADGPVELENGTIVEVAAGKVVKVTELAANPNAPVEPAKMEGITPEVEKAIADYVTKVKDELQGQIDELKAMFGDYAKTPDINTKVDDAIKELNELLSNKQDAKENGEKFSAIDDKLKSIVELMEQIANMPVGPAKEEKFEQKSKRETAIRKMAESFSKLK